ncbi:hypothetical protein DRN73_04405 [Candidatus Pacearchaeota archaeon]|nr:MAG: hypothetical protein DRN73_04405 [Candidatus Pacearchaeota archaeon]
MRVNFFKFVAVDNDFVVFDYSFLESSVFLNPFDFAKKVCNRKMGIGCDGVIFVGKDDYIHISFEGKEIFLCGNASRIAGIYIFEKRGVKEIKFLNKNVEVKIFGKMGNKYEVGLNLGQVCEPIELESGIFFVEKPVGHVVVFEKDKFDVDYVYNKYGIGFINYFDIEKLEVKSYERHYKGEVFSATGVAESFWVAYKKYGLKKSVFLKVRNDEKIRVWLDEKQNLWFSGNVLKIFEGRISLWDTE